MTSTNKITVGLDLGTDKCCITYQDIIGRPFIITDNKNHKISSIIGILNNGILVGNEISKECIYDIPIITNLKRLIGHKASDSESQIIASYHQWQLSDGENDLIININNNSYTLNELMCVLLRKLKEIIISNIGENFDVVITIPANFNEGQKNSILSYCSQVGIDCKRLIYEPCSAALAYINYFDSIIPENLINSIHLDPTDPTDSTDSADCTDILKNIMVFDFGAGTLDLAIVSCYCAIDNTNPENIEWMTKIEKNIGDNNLGGLDIDIVLGDYLKNKFPEFDKLLEAKNESIKFIVEKIKIKLGNLYQQNNNPNQSIIERYYNIALIINIDEYFSL